MRVMPSTGAKTALSPTMTKAEVIEYLGKSKRSVETYVSSARLRAKYVHGANGKTLSFERADVEAFKVSMEAPWEPNAPIQRAVPAAVATAQMSAPAPTAIQAYAANVDPLAALAALLNRPAESPKPKDWLTLDEAVTVSGLTRTWLLNETASRKPLVAIRDMGKGARGGRWRFNRVSLERP